MTDATQNGNGHQPRERIKFGPGASQDMPAEWAEHILAALASGSNAQRAKFGKLLADAALNGK